LKQSADIPELIIAAKNNDQKAQMILYERYVRAMYNTACRIVGNSDDAEDVTQEAFIKAFDKLDSYKGTATFGAWLKRIVINQSLNWLRKNKNLQYDALTNSNIEAETEIELPAENIKITCMLKAIDELKDNYKIALNLHYIEGYDYEEMMQILNLSYANVRTLVSRAKKKLKSILETEYSDIIKS